MLQIPRRIVARARRSAWTPAAIAVSAVFVLPLAAMIAASFRSPGLPPPRGLEIFPASPGLSGYRQALSLVPLARGLLNSVVVVSVAVPLAVLIASLAGYGLSLLRPRRRGVVVGIQLVLAMVPASALWVPRFALFKVLGLTGTYVPIVAPALLGGSPLFVLLYYVAFRRIPRDVMDAARLEGASRLHVWRRVAMPLTRATTVAVGLLVFALWWGNFIDPLLFLTDERTFTAPLMVRTLEQLGPTNWPVVLAASTLVTVPAVAALVLALRFIAPREGPGWLGI